MSSQITGIDPDSLGNSSQEYIKSTTFQLRNLIGRPSSSKKKPRKRTALGASSSRIRKRKAPATPLRSEPSSPETVSPPAPQPAP
ncbi:hypothetical protein PanWU01x14_192970 [Parasponia andersonii]|uniref:Uncharacterized protein n=1 Tax=Parasponia andersonii TaxID=3476 RepID=A0A2P5C190_PARAD|nr:hypothetical protein PanWU01x14_192970 [Parasponia andersonii]